MAERLQKLISAAGLASRRQAEEWIKEGRVRLNGNTARLGDVADLSEDVVEVDGRKIPKAQCFRYLILNKPKGYVTTLSDDRGRPAVTDLLKDVGERVYPVGRLDFYSEGLLLLTNDGELANSLTHPSKEIEKTYIVWTVGQSDGAEELLRRPIVLDGRAIAVPKVRLCSSADNTARWEITIHEGRNRQIRRMCEAAGLKVTRLIRISEGPVSLGRLEKGSWRELTAEELEKLKNAAK